MGQEWASSSPFLYFTDHEAELGRAVTEGRRREFAKFAAFATADGESRVPDPQALETFARSKLDWREQEEPEHERALALYRSALALRRRDFVLREPSRERLSSEAQGDALVVVRFRDAEARVLVVNFGSSPFATERIEALRAMPDARPVLSNPPDLASGTLPPGAAVIFAGGWVGRR